MVAMVKGTISASIAIGLLSILRGGSSGSSTNSVEIVHIAPPAATSGTNSLHRGEEDARSASEQDEPRRGKTGKNMASENGATQRAAGRAPALATAP